MKSLFAFAFIIVISAGVFSQPLNGSYTIGGNSPDFITLQDAANALKVNGISGPVFFNIRPGIYMENGGSSTVLLLDSIVTGLSEENRVTFQPDAATGGNVDNTILQMNITNTTTADPQLVLVRLDFISFNNITFQESDASLNTGNCNLVQLQKNFFTGTLTVNGIVFEGCRFIGTESSAGTENGIEFGQGISNITIRGNTFLRLLRGISGATGTSTSIGNLTIEDNQFLAGWRSSSGSGNPLGSAMEIFSENLFIRRNIIDFNGSFNGGYHGIFLFTKVGTVRTIVEQNSIDGPVSAAIKVQGFIGGRSDSLVVANNMINAYVYQVWANEPAVGISISQNPGNAQILFNTIVVYGGGLIGLSVKSENSKVLNNIIIAKPTGGFNVGYDQGNAQSPNLQSDYNVIYMEGSPLVIRDAVQYPNLSSYQTGTGLDTNSISKDIDFTDSTNLHISDCQAQDPDLKGIPVPEILVDIDEEIRSTTTPMIGADENGFSSFDMFGEFQLPFAPMTSLLTGAAFSVETGDYDEDGDDDIAVTNYDDREIFIRINTSNPVSGQSFNTIVQPVVVKFYDLDEDSNLDLIVGGDTTAVEVLWGDGTGGFSSPVLVETFGRVRSLEPGPIFTGDVLRTIMITEDNGFGSNTSTIGYLMHLGNRVLCHDVQYAPGNIPPDTIDAVMTDFVTGDFAGDGGIPEIAAVTSFPLPHPLVIDSDILFLASAGTPCANFVPRGTFNEYQFGTGVGSTAGQSNIVTGDFDGDGDLDLITLETFSSVLFIKNLGSINFTSESISVTGAQGLAAMDYENDGDLDFLTVNERLEENGITIFLNDGFGNFISRENCFFPFASGRPWSVATSDFDQDGRMDIAIVASIDVGVDSLFVLRNLGGGTVGIQDQEIVEIPTEFLLSQNYPNPFNPTTTIKFSIPEASVVTLKIYNILGEEVKTLVDEYREIGNHTTQFDASSLSSGIYLYRMQTSSFVETKKMLLLK